MPRSFRALTYYKQYGCGTMLMGGTTPVALDEMAVGVHPRQLKNIRGDFQFTTADSTPTSADAAMGWVALVRWPSSEAYTNTNVDLQDPRTLHPVVWQYRLYPGHIRYEFKGINLSQHDKLYVVCHKGCQTGNDSTYVDWVLQWAQLDHPSTG